MLAVHQLSKAYGLQVILKDISFNISPQERVGLIGPNGCGKSTLLRILAGRETADSGTFAASPLTLRIGYLSQGFELDPQLTLAEACSLEKAGELDSTLPDLASALAAHPGDPDLQSRWDELVRSLSAGGPAPQELLTRLGLAALPVSRTVSQLSGGQKTRLMLARLLLSEPQLLLLDEPTNHLDISTLEWLEGWLQGFRGAALIVSHDRTFLDHSVSRVLELDPARHDIQTYSGNYTDYFDQKQAEQARQLSTYLDQQDKIRRMKADIARTKEQAAHTERAARSIRIGGPDYKITGYKTYQQAVAKGTARKAKSREKKLEHYLESGELVERPHPAWQVKLEFQAPQHQSRDRLLTEDLSIGYPGSAPLLEHLHLHIRAGGRIALTGPNGCGKTTLLRTISGQLPALEGRVRVGASARIGSMTQEQELLDLGASPLEIIQSTGSFTQTEARHFLHYFLFSGDDPLRPCGEMSYGERSRLQLAVLVAQGCSFLLLDEPINHLDIPARARFEQALARTTVTVLAVVHDRYFISRFATESWVVEEGRIRICWKGSTVAAGSSR
jgi:ATP-binding cassette subfamily F protein 3